jgi:hypothetical protein
LHRNENVSFLEIPKKRTNEIDQFARENHFEKLEFNKEEDLKKIYPGMEVWMAVAKTGIINFDTLSKATVVQL